MQKFSLQDVTDWTIGRASEVAKSAIEEDLALGADSLVHEYMLWRGGAGSGATPRLLTEHLERMPPERRALFDRFWEECDELPLQSVSDSGGLHSVPNVQPNLVGQPKSITPLTRGEGVTKPTRTLGVKADTTGAIVPRQESTVSPSNNPLVIRVDKDEFKLRPIDRRKQHTSYLWVAISASVIVAAALALLYRSNRKPGATQEPPVVVNNGAPTTKKNGGAVVQSKPSNQNRTKEERQEPANDEALASLLEAIHQYPSSKPYPVREASLRDLRKQAVKYNQEHPGNQEIATFIAASEPSDANEMKYLVAQANELKNPTKGSAEVRSLRNQMLAFEQARGKTLNFVDPTIGRFLEWSKSDDDLSLSADLKARVEALMDQERFPEIVHFSRPDGTGTLLLSQLHSPIRDRAIRTYAECQQFARKQGSGQLDPKIRDFLLHARRPSDVMGVIMPVYANPVTPEGQQAFNRILPLGRYGIDIKVVVATGVENANDQGFEPLARWIQSIRNDRGNRISVLINIDCQNGMKPFQDIDDEVEEWRKFAGTRLQGVCFVSVPTDPDNVEQFTQLFERIKRKQPNWQIVIGLGGEYNDAYLTPDGSTTLLQFSSRSVASIKGWEANYDLNRFASVVNSVPDKAAMHAIVEDATFKHFKWVFPSSLDDSLLPPNAEDLRSFITKLNAVNTLISKVLD
jgi:hypothetical protein